MLIARLPVFPSNGEVFIGDTNSDPDTWPDWTDEEFEQGFAVSPGMIYIRTAEPPALVRVDVLDGKPAGDHLVIYEGTLTAESLSITGGQSQPTTLFVMPSRAAWQTIITVNDRAPERVRHVSVYFPEYADPNLSDGLN